MKPTLAILDWGIGGIDFYRLFKEKYPRAGVCYFSDAGVVPYGKQNKEQLKARLGNVAAFLKQRGVRQLVVACNAMSTVLPEVSFEDFDVTGVIEPSISAVKSLKASKVGIVGGRRTILSGAYGKPLRQHFPSVTQRIAQPLSALIERGEKDTPLFQETLQMIMAPLKKSDILVLACTHYPAAWDDFQRLAPGATLVSPAAETLTWVTENWRLDDSPAHDIFFTSGDSDAMQSASEKAFGVRIGEITRLGKGFMA